MTDVGPEALDLLTVKEVAGRLRFSPRTIWRLVAAERKEPGTGLVSVRQGRSVRIPPEAVADYKKRLCAGNQNRPAA